MNIIMLSPYFPVNYQQFPMALKNWGVNVLGIGDMPYDMLNDTLKQSLTEYFKVDYMEDYDQLLRATGYFTFKYGKIDRIDSHNEHWLEKEAQLRTDFNINGIKTDAIRQIKDKSQMKKVFIDCGIPVAKGKVIKDLKTAKQFVKEVGFPIVAKPDTGVGAADTYKIKTQAELDHLFKEKPNVDYIFEEFIDGDIYSFDGLTDQDGNVVFYTVHRFKQGVMETVNDDLDIYYYSLRKIPDDIKEYGLRLVQAFNVRERFFHFEFFRLHKSRKLVALEVNMRPPGGFTTDMFNYANDINIYQEWTNIIMHNKFNAHYDRKYHCCYIGRKLSKQYLHTHDEILSRYYENIVMNAEMSGVFSPALGNYFYMVRHEDFDTILEMISFIHEKSE